jgi:hypothetical protein
VLDILKCNRFICLIECRIEVDNLLYSGPKRHIRLSPTIVCPKIALHTYRLSQDEFITDVTIHSLLQQHGQCQLIIEEILYDVVMFLAAVVATFIIGRHIYKHASLNVHICSATSYSKCSLSVIYVETITILSINTPLKYVPTAIRVVTNVSIKFSNQYKMVLAHFVDKL